MRTNTLARRSKRAETELARRSERLYKALVEPAPYGMVRLGEIEALRRYLQARESGGLLTMRRSMGGDYPDEDVDRWAARMSRLEAKYLPGKVATEFIREVAGPADELVPDQPFAGGGGTGGAMAPGYPGDEPLGPPPETSEGFGGGLG